MKKKRIMASFPIRILAVSIPGLLAGLFLNVTRTMGLTSGALNLVVTARYVLSQIITFLAPLIIIGLVASSIISVKKAPTPATAPVVRITYFSMLGAAAFASVLGYLIIPKLPVSTDSLSFRFLPDTLFELPIPAPVSALSALVLAILLALGACWTNAVRTKELLQEFRGITLSLMSRVLLPILDVQNSSSTVTCLYRAFSLYTGLSGIFHQVSATVASGTYYYNSGLYGLGVGSVSYCRILCRRKGMGNFEKLYTGL